MENYWVWFNDEGENKGETITTFSDVDAACQYYLKYEDDVIDSTGAVFVRDQDGKVTKKGIRFIEDTAYGAGGYRVGLPPIEVKL